MTQPLLCVVNLPGVLVVLETGAGLDGAPLQLINPRSCGGDFTKPHQVNLLDVRLEYNVGLHANTLTLDVTWNLHDPDVVWSSSLELQTKPGCCTEDVLYNIIYSLQHVKIYYN